jgi:hypothetical protein
MFDDDDAPRSKPTRDPQVRALEKIEEFRMHAELAAVFEAPRKFGAAVLTDLPTAVSRDLQLTLARLDKARANLGQLIPPAPLASPAASEPATPLASAEAMRLLTMPETEDLSTGDYHLCRRPGEVTIARWVVGDEVDTFYTRLQAHFDVALEGHKDDERQDNAWKNDPDVLSYLDALEKNPVNLAEVYLRPQVRQHGVFAINTQTADEINIEYLADYLMGVAPADVVGDESAPPEAPTESDLAWYFKLFLLRGIRDGTERALFFTFLQKTDGEW